MDPVLQDLVQLLDLERIENNIFRGQSRDIGTPQVFGGQVLGQAMSAASQTVTDRVPHSLSRSEFGQLHSWCHTPSIDSKLTQTLRSKA